MYAWLQTGHFSHLPFVVKYIEYLQLLVSFSAAVDLLGLWVWPDLFFFPSVGSVSKCMISACST